MRASIKCLCLFILTSFYLSLSAEEKEIHVFHPDSVSHYFTRQLDLYPQEKIYVQTDKPSYIAAEEIWFRAYLVDATFHIPDTTSRYVYAELINPENELVERVKVRVEDGAYKGYISIPEKSPEGDYLLRFYTRYMEQMGEEYFFKRPVRIGTLAELSENNPDKKNDERNFDVSFFPEGGALPFGVQSKIAFKALNQDGLGEDITGVVINEKNDTLFHFKSSHLGMGHFWYEASAGETIYAVCKNKEGIEKKLLLPKGEENAVALQLSRAKNIIHVKINHSPKETLPDTLSLIFTCRGVVVYEEDWTSDTKTLMLSEELFPSGVLQALLITKEGIPLSERLLFLYKEEEFPSLSFLTTKENYSSREKVDVSIQLLDNEGFPLKGELSVGITDDRDVLPDSTMNILSSLLLTSELKGHIESPTYYLKDKKAATQYNLDNLMMTQGWRRYNVTKVLEQNYEVPIRKKEWSMEVSGTVKGGLMMNRGREGYPVTMISRNPFFLLETESNEKGEFIFDRFETPDSMTFAIQGKTTKGGKGVEVLLKEELFPSNLFLLPQREKSDSTFFTQYLKKADNQLLLTKGIRTVHLSDVVVTAEIKKQRGRSAYSSAMNERYTTENFGERVHGTLLDLLREHVPGIVVQGETIYFARNLGSGQPVKVLVDNMELSLMSPGNIQAVDVEEIELMKDGGAAIFNAAGGAILVTTKRGDGARNEVPVFNIKNITPLGYQIAREFYSPSYEIKERESEFQNPDLRTTIYWNPDIKTDEQGKATFDFYTAESFSSYSVVIEGITENGLPFYKKESINGK